MSVSNPGYVPRSLKRSAYRRREDTKNSSRTAGVVLQVVLSAFFAFLGLIVGLKTEESLQRTEVSVASKNAAYIELIRAGDEVLTPNFVLWELGATLANAGGDESVRTQVLEARTQEDLDKQNALRDAANQLRLVIDKDDASLITDFVASLDAGFPSVGSGTEDGIWPTAGQRLIAYSDAKLAVVNRFRAEVLNEGELPPEEADRMLVLDQEIINAKKALQGAVETLDKLSESPQQVPAP